MARPRTPGGWAAEFATWLAPFLAVLPRCTHRNWAPRYVAGLLGPTARKNVKRLADAVAAGEYDPLHHFLTTAAWDAGPLLRVLAETAQGLVGGPEAVLIVDDTTLLKQGTHSVGVARQYSGRAGKLANCQCLVSLTLARGEVPVPVALRLFLPRRWAGDPARCAEVGIPPAECVHKAKGQLALEELDRVRAAGVTFGLVLADAGYGTNREFRRGLSARGLRWAVGLLSNQHVYPADVTVRRRRRRSGPGRTGRPPHGVRPTRAAVTTQAMLAAVRWRRLTWRDGTKGPLAARFAAVRVRVAEGPTIGHGQRLPGADEVWLVGEERASGERKYYVSNLPAATSVRALAQAIKARWVCEQAHQQLKGELGLAHFEGRSWAGLHHHALLTMIAFAFLQHYRLSHLTARAVPAARGEIGGPPPAPSLPAIRRLLLAAALPQLTCPRCGTPIRSPPEKVPE